MVRNTYDARELLEIPSAFPLLSKELQAPRLVPLEKVNVRFRVCRIITMSYPAYSSLERGEYRKLGPVKSYIPVLTRQRRITASAVAVVEPPLVVSLKCDIRGIS